MGSESKDEQTGAQAGLQAYHMTSTKTCRKHSATAPPFGLHWPHQAGEAFCRSHAARPPRHQPSLPTLWTAADATACQCGLLLGKSSA